MPIYDNTNVQECIFSFSNVFFLPLELLPALPLFLPFFFFYFLPLARSTTVFGTFYGVKRAEICTDSVRFTWFHIRTEIRYSNSNES